MCGPVVYGRRDCLLTVPDSIVRRVSIVPRVKVSVAVRWVGRRNCGPIWRRYTPGVGVGIRLIECTGGLFRAPSRQAEAVAVDNTRLTGGAW